MFIFIFQSGWIEECVNFHLVDLVRICQARTIQDSPRQQFITLN
jgi:hypothetical protein